MSKKNIGAILALYEYFVMGDKIGNCGKMNQ